MQPIVRLDAETIEQISERVCALLLDQLAAMGLARDVHTAAQARLVDAKTLAGMLGVSRDTVYEHAVALGGQHVGAPRGRWRFDPAVALEGWIHRSRRRDPQDARTTAAAGRTRPRRRRGSGSTPGLLPIHGDPLPLPTDSEGS